MVHFRLVDFLGYLLMLL